MKKRWMKTVIETSRQDMPALPFQRKVRKAMGTQPALAKVKTA